MNKRIIPFILLLVLFIVGGVLFMLNSEDQRESPEAMLVEDNNDSLKKPSIEKAPELSGEEQELLQQFTAEEIENLKYSHQAAQAANQNVIFYGQCIDQDGTPIEGVQIEAKVTKMRKSMIAVVAAESFKYYEQLSVLTGENGRFEFKAIGSYLLLEKIRHPDYLNARGPESFGYQFGQILYGNTMAGMHQADPLKPVVFTMWKKGEGSATIQPKSKFGYKADIGMAREQMGKPHLFQLSLRKKTNQLSADTLEITAQNAGNRYWDPELFKSVGSRYQPWSYTLRMPGGGIAKTDDLFLFRPPEDGYEESYQFEVSEGEEGWISKIENQKFYFKTSDGNYGAFTLEVRTSPEGGAGFDFDQIYFNPNGERNLEHFE